MREAKGRRFSETALSLCLSLLLADLTRLGASIKQRPSVLQQRAKAQFPDCRPIANCSETASRYCSLVGETGPYERIAGPAYLSVGPRTHRINFDPMGKGAKPHAKNHPASLV
jgi:hypothetical protein